MDDTPFRGVHGRHLDGPSLADGAAGSSMGHTLYCLDAALAVPLSIEHHTLEEGTIPERGDVDEILECIDGLALLAYEQGRVIRGDVCGDEPPCVVDLNTGFEAHSVENRGYEHPYFIQQILRGFDQFILRGFAVDLGKRRRARGYRVVGGFRFGLVHHNGIVRSGFRGTFLL